MAPHLELGAGRSEWSASHPGIVCDSVHL